MTTRIRYAVQYPAREGSGKEPLYLTVYLGRAMLESESVAIMGETRVVETLCASWHICEAPDSDHLPARVVRVRETVTREIITE